MGREELGNSKIIIPSSEQEESEHFGVTQADRKLLNALDKTTAP